MTYDMTPSYYKTEGNAAGTYTCIQSTSDGVGFNMKLPLPNQLDYSSNFDWSVDTISIAASHLVDAAKNMFNKDGSFVENTSSALDSLSNASTAGATETLRSLGITALGKLGGVINGSGAFNHVDLSAEKIAKFLPHAAGFAYNPNDVLYFNGTSHRNFALSFDIVPLSAEQAQQCSEGIHKLRVLASPSFASSNKTFFKYPSLFSLVVSVNNEIILQRNEFAIKTINTNLSPNGVMSWHEDGSPVAYTLLIECVETLITTADIEEKRNFLLSQGSNSTPTT